MPSLDPVTQRFIADVTPYMDAMEALIAVTEEATGAVQDLINKINEIPASKTVTIFIKQVGETDIHTNVVGVGGGAGLGALETQMNDVIERAAAMDNSLRSVRIALDDMALASAADGIAIVGALNRVEATINDVAGAAVRDAAVTVAALNEIRDAVLLTAGTVAVLNTTTRDSGAGAAAAAAGFRIWGTGIRLTGAALHWIVAGAAEFLAVAIPAAVALAAGIAVAAQGAQNAYNHFQALYTATEATAQAFHQTVGSVLGVGSALQRAQNQANPGVYEILGAAVNTMKGNFTGLQGQLLTTQSGFSSLAQTGLTVLHVFDQFAAKLTVELGSGLGAQIHGLLSGMVTDLTRFAQILGNVGHAILNFASAMPGLAAVLLAIATAVSRVILFISSIPAPIITAVMAIEEFYRWGGLALSLLIRLAAAPAAFVAWLTGVNFITNFGSALLSLIATMGTVLVSTGGMVAGLGAEAGAFEAVGVAAADAGGAMLAFATTTSPLMMAGIAGLVAGLVAGVVMISRIKDATDQWIAATDKAVQSASAMNVLNVISKTMAENAIRMAAAQRQVATDFSHTSASIGVASRYVGQYSGVAQRAAQDVANLSQQQQYLVNTGVRVIQNAANLGAVFRTSASGALALASAAGVNLTQAMARGTMAFAVAVQQIRNYIAGIGAMGAPLGTLGADVMALGIQSQLAATKVQQLNQAWDAWIQSTTAAAASMSQVQTALNGMSQAGLASSNRLTGAISSIDHATKGTTYTLHGFGQAAMQSWQQFTSAVQTGNSALDTLRVGMAEGVVSGTQFKTTVQGMVGEMLKFTQGNPAAVQMLSQLAHEAGGPVTTSLKTLAQWAGVAGNAARNQFAKGMLAASIAMGNMAKVAQNLSAVVFGNMNKAMGTAITQNSGLNTAIQKYATDLKNVHTPASQLATDQHTIATAMERANQMIAKSSVGMSKAVQQADAHAAATAKDAAATANAATKTADQATAASRAEEAIKTNSMAMQTSTGSANVLSGKINTLNSAISGSAGKLQSMTTQIQNGGKAAQTSSTQVQNLHTQIDNAGSAAQTAQGKMSTLGSQMATAGNEAQTAAGKVQALATAINNLPTSKTITITTVTQTVHRAAGGPIFPGVPTVVGEMGRELYVPTQPGWVFNNAQTERLLSPVASPATAAAIGGGGGQGTAVIHNHVYLDGKQIWQGMQQETLKYGIRNGVPQSGRWAPGSQASG